MLPVCPFVQTITLKVAFPWILKQCGKETSCQIPNLIFVVVEILDFSLDLLFKKTLLLTFVGSF